MSRDFLTPEGEPSLGTPIGIEKFERYPLPLSPEIRRGRKTLCKQVKINLILAYQLQKLIEDSKIDNLKRASEWLNIDQARLDHTITLLLLSPAIQTEIISGDSQILSLIPEYKVRSLVAQFDWQKQAEIWKNIKESLA